MVQPHAYWILIDLLLHTNDASRESNFNSQLGFSLHKGG